MSQNAINEEGNQMAQRLLIEIPNKPEVEQFHLLSSIQETTSQQYIESNQGSGVVGSLKLSQLNTSGNIKAQNNRTYGSLLNSEMSNYIVSEDENEEKEENQNQDQYQYQGNFKKEKVNTIQEEELNDSDNEIFDIPPDIEPIEKPLSYDELNRKCKNLEEEVKKGKSIYEKLLDQTTNDQNKIRVYEEQERNNKNVINQNVTTIQSLEEKNQQIQSQLKELQEINVKQKLIIQKHQEKINQIELQLEDQIRYNNLQKQQFLDQITAYQTSLGLMKTQQENNLKSGMQKSNESKVDLKQNELLKIKDEIIIFLENELADCRVSNIQKKQENINKPKLNTNSSEKEIINSLGKMKVKTTDQLIPKPQIEKKQLAPQDCQKIFQSQVNSQAKSKISWIAQLDEKNKQMLKSYSNSQRNNQSFSNLNCSITESVNQNCQTNDHQLFLIDNT